MMKKLLKIKWLRLIEALLFIVSILIALYMTGLFITNGLSWFGLITLMTSVILAWAIYEDFKEKIEKMSATRTSQHLKRYN